MFDLIARFKQLDSCRQAAIIYGTYVLVCLVISAWYSVSSVMGLASEYGYAHPFFLRVSWEMLWPVLLYIGTSPVYLLGGIYILNTRRIRWIRILLVVFLIWLVLVTLMFLGSLSYIVTEQTLNFESIGFFAATLFVGYKISMAGWYHKPKIESG